MLRKLNNELLPVNELYDLLLCIKYIIAGCAHFIACLSEIVRTTHKSTPEKKRFTRFVQLSSKRKQLSRDHSVFNAY